MDESRRRSPNILGPVLLIAIGTILLLNTLGMVDWSVWLTLLRLWPIFLISAGLDLLLGRRSAWGSLLAAVLLIAVIAGALWLALGSDTGGGGLVDETIRQPLDGAQSAAIVLDPGVGRLLVEALPESADLVRGTVTRRPGETLRQEAKGGARASFSLGAGDTSEVPFGMAAVERRTWELGLSPAAVLDLKTSMGAGETILDLTGLQLGRLEVNAGVGRTEIRLPAAGRFEATIDSAVGEMVVIVPAGLAVRFQVSTGIAARNMPAGFARNGDVYTSPGYDTAADRAEVQVNQAIGALTVRTAE